MATLFIFGGLPGTGKSVLARELARRRRAVYLRIDSIEQALRDGGTYRGGPEGYGVACRLAADNLRIGLCVVADSVNPVEAARAAWRRAARGAGASFLEIEVVCSDRREHRRRVESRTVDVPGLRLPTWSDVRHREYEPWAGVHLVIDTAGRTVEQSMAEIHAAVGAAERGPEAAAEPC